MSEVKKFDFVDALRGVAVLAVLLVHTGMLTSAQTGWAGELIGQGAKGVQLFYVMSAFTLFLSLDRRNRGEAYPTTNFFIRRFFRIAPLFYVAVPFYLWKDGMGPRYWAPHGITAWHVVSVFTFTNGWHPETINGIVSGGWSVAIEMMFYLVVPLCFAYVTTLRRAVALVAASFVIGMGVSLATFIYLSPHYPPDQRYLVASFASLFWLPAEVSVFCLGFVLFFVFKKIDPKNPRNVARGMRCIWTSAAVMLALAFIRLPARHFAYGVAFVLLAYGLMLSSNRIIVNKFTCLVGKVSYSMYLVQFAAMAILEKTVSAGVREGKGLLVFLAFYGLFVIVTLLISMATYRFIEQPGRLLGKKLIEKLEARALSGRTFIRA